MLAALGQRVGTVAAPSRTAAFGLDANLSALRKIGLVVDQIPFGGNPQWLGPGRGIDLQHTGLTIYQSRHIVPTPLAANGVQQSDCCSFTVTPNPEIGTRPRQQRLGKDRISDAAQDNRCVGVPVDRGDIAFQDRHEALAAGPETIVGIAKGQAHQIRRTAAEAVRQHRFGVLAWIEIHELHIVPGGADRCGDVIQTERSDRRLHAVGIDQRQHEIAALPGRCGKDRYQRLGYHSPSPVLRPLGRWSRAPLTPSCRGSRAILSVKMRTSSTIGRARRVISSALPTTR